MLTYALPLIMTIFTLSVTAFGSEVTDSAYSCQIRTYINNIDTTGLTAGLKPQLAFVTLGSTDTAEDCSQTSLDFLGSKTDAGSTIIKVTFTQTTTGTVGEFKYRSVNDD